MLNCTNVFSPLNPEWVLEKNSVGYDDEFWSIINFYLLHSLCDGQSWKNNRLHETYLWKLYPWNPSEYLKDKLIKAIWGEKSPKLYMAQTRAELEVKIYDKGLDENFADDVSSQRACFVKVSKGKNNGSEIMGLLYHIRNGFAHGRYGIIPVANNDYMFFLEDGNENGDLFEVTARIAIKKSSLLAVRDIIIEGPDDDPDYAVEIINSINRGNDTKTKIIKDIDISEKIWNRESQKLKDEGILIIEKKKWKTRAVMMAGNNGSVKT